MSGSSKWVPRSALAAEEGAQRLMKVTSPGVDSEARWIKKAGKARFGYKKHYVCHPEGLRMGVHTTADVNEISNLEEVLDSADLPDNTHVYGDKGYRSKKNEELVQGRKLKSRVLHKATKSRALTGREKLRNKLIGKTRFKVERTFGSIKRFQSGYARYKGVAKMHAQNIMEAIAYNIPLTWDSCVQFTKNREIRL